MSKRSTNIFFTIFLLVGCTNFCAACQTSAYESAGDNRILGYRLMKSIEKIQDKDGKEIRLEGAISILPDRSNKIWISTPLGVYLYNEKTDLWTIIQASTQPSALLWAEIYQSHDSRIWLRSKITGGVKYVNENTLQEDKRLSGHFVQAIFNGTGGKLWFVLENEIIYYEDGTWSSPIYLPDKIQRDYAQRPQKTVSIHPLAIEKYLKAQRKDNASQDTASMFSFVDIKAGLQDRDGGIWLGGLRAILRLDFANKDWKILSIPEKLAGIYHIYEDRKNGMWFSDKFRNVAFCDKENKDCYSYTLFYPTIKDYQQDLMNFIAIHTVYQDRQGRMMFATSQGLITLLREKDKWETFTSHNSALQDNEVTTVTEDNQGRIWIGTIGGILVLEL